MVRLAVKTNPCRLAATGYTPSGIVDGVISTILRLSITKFSAVGSEGFCGMGLAGKIAGGYVVGGSHSFVLVVVGSPNEVNARQVCKAGKLP